MSNNMRMSAQNYSLIRNFYDTDQLVSFRSLEDIPYSVAQDLKLVSMFSGFKTPKGKYTKIKRNYTYPFGSYINRVSDYYGDVDGIQLLSHAKSKEEIVKQATYSLVQIVKDIKKAKDRWYSETKAGIDHLFLFDIGKCVEGVYRISDQLVKTSETLYASGMLSNVEIKVIRNIVNKRLSDRDGDDYDVIFNLFRKKWLLRWTADEILQKYKVLKRPDKDIKYTLEQAVSDNTILKIDMLAYDNNNKFIEITNFMMIGFNKNNEFIPINIDPDTHNPFYLRTEIEKLYYSNYYYKPFKIVKRSFAFLKFLWRKWDKKALADHQPILIERGITKNLVQELLNGYVQILDSTINILYTINSELDAITLLMERVKNPPINKINDRIDMLRDPLSNVLEIDDDNLKYFVSSKGLFDNIIIQNNPTKKLAMIKDLMKIFNEIINFWTITYFNKTGLNPPSSVVLPEILTYNPNIIRQPDDVPINPLDLAIADAEGKRGGFIKSLGKKFFRKVANAYRSRNKEKLPDGRPKVRPLLPGEYHYLHGNFIGPGTRVDLPEIRDYPAFNDVDNCARTHDLDYMHAIELPEGERQQAIIEADKKAIQCFAKYPDQEGSKVGQMGLNSKMKLGNVLPIVSNAIFGKISSGDTKKKPTLIDPRAPPKKSRAGRTVANTPANRKKYRQQRYRNDRYRPGEDPEVSKLAFKRAFSLVSSIFKEDPKGFADALKNIATDIFGIASAKKLTPGQKAHLWLIQEASKYVGLDQAKKNTDNQNADIIKKNRQKGGKVWYL